ncbi:hypothetical protein [Curtobacterium sp. VKM Ac-2884]|uniref:hypothetical protein n=1 Tax=Curtobacterium sp. VKM Ac-2884 TaxID=2783818 RepID=UPI00188B5AF0|nr:hypothetical protein [Curtobacterium sp. VKM Ac-2884]MBF4603750.1 hypothetical protein [Curtobacterium sp. VKM Ac-2884]
MARIQVLELPSDVVGEAVHTPFVIVVDQVEVEARVESVDEQLIHEIREPINADAIKAASGAVGVIVHTGTLDVA